MNKVVERGEFVVVGNGYHDEKRVGAREGIVNERTEKIKNHHKSVNSRLKRFFVLGHKFRQTIWKHAQLFHAVANLTQLVIVQRKQIFFH